MSVAEPPAPPGPTAPGSTAAAGEALLETEGLALAREISLAVPRYRVVEGAAAVAELDLSDLPGKRVVVKALSRRLPHKSELGAVRLVAKEPGAVAREIEAMAGRLRQRAGIGADDLEGFGVFEHVPHEPGAAGELLLGMRWTDDFGAVVTVGPGGIEAELLAGSLRPRAGSAIFSPLLLSRPDRSSPQDEVRAILASRPLLRAVTEPFRGREPAVGLDELAALVVRFLVAAERLLPETVAELEFNPVALTARGPVALDAAGRWGPGETGPEGAAAADPEARARRHRQMARLLAPRSVAVVGVSEREPHPERTPGRILLRNLLQAGFPAKRIRVVKPGEGAIDGCRRVPDLAALPEPVDLLVLAVAAGEVPALVEEAVAGRRAESVVVIPGGLGETEGTEGRAAAVRATLEAARRTGWGGPVVNGGNCLGVRSVPGRLDTLFIPRHKLRFPERPDRVPDPLGLVSQSGAFAIARASKLRTLDPRYLVTVGNQLDLTVGDWVEHLVDDPGSRVVACYVEGFRPGDGRRFLEAAAEIARQGRTVLLYRAGRTAAGARASASHTASIAGDFAVCRELAREAGVVVAETLEDFEDLVGLFVRLDGRAPGDRRLGVLTNAGFEAVAVADRLGPLRLAAWSEATRRRLADLLAERRLGELVSPANPLDVTPMMDDAGFAEAARAVLADPGVDLAVVGCVPLTGAMNTVARYDASSSDRGRAPGPEHDEDGTREGAVAPRLAALAWETGKPWVTVIDSGSLYDPVVRLLEDAGVPTFRTADRAVRLLGLWAEHAPPG